MVRTAPTYVVHLLMVLDVIEHVIVHHAIISMAVISYWIRQVTKDDEIRLITK